MHHNLEQLVKQWDRLSTTANSSGQEYADIDSLHWFNYLAFDVIGDLVSLTPYKLLCHNQDLPSPDTTRLLAPLSACSTKAGTSLKSAKHQIAL